MAHVLAVCTANLVRSPVAEAALAAGARRMAVHDLSFSSAGTAAFEGHPVPAELIQAIRPFFLDLHAHRSHAVTREDLRASSLVLSMTEDQREALRSLLPAATPRIFTLREFARLTQTAPTLGEVGGDFDVYVRAVHRERPRRLRPRDREDIEDAYGGTAKQYHACITEVVGQVDRITARWG